MLYAIYIISGNKLREKRLLWMAHEVVDDICGLNMLFHALAHLYVADNLEEGLM